MPCSTTLSLSKVRPAGHRPPRARHKNGPTSVGPSQARGESRRAYAIGVSWVGMVDSVLGPPSGDGGSSLYQTRRPPRKRWSRGDSNP